MLSQAGFVTHTWLHGTESPFVHAVDIKQRIGRTKKKFVPKIKYRMVPRAVIQLCLGGAQWPLAVL